MAARFGKQGPPQGPHPSLGTFFEGPRPYGFAAAPTRPGRKHGGTTVPALGGLFRAGRPGRVGLSKINTIATNIHRGQG